MQTNRRSPTSSALVLMWVLGCASAPSGATPALPPAPGAQDDFEPIRFGDLEQHVYEQPFFPGATHDAAITTPDSLLGQPVGSRLARHAEIVNAFRQWARESARIEVASYGRTYEGRELIRAVITSQDNHARLEQIKSAVQRLSDPRGLDDAQAQRIIAETPAIAWMGYSIHGDETSGVDASLAVAYHLVAGTGEDVTGLLDAVVVVMDPCMNPDGRTRILTMVEQSAGYRANLDADSMHRGRWPYGRGNHYLFDMNRDWMAGVCPETRARWKVNLEFRPQLFVDAHEMSGLDTFLFYPQSHPRNPELPEQLFEWQRRFGDDAARAFDRHGWGYYTREWAEAWYPGYSDAWGSLNGAVGMLYEQAGVGGQALRRESGEVVSYREAVHGQAVASLANLTTLSSNREAILRDYLAQRRHNVDASLPGADRAFVFVPRNPSRTQALLETLLGQGIEVYQSEAPFDATEAVSALDVREERRTFPAGTYVVPTVQPQASLVRTYLGFDPHIDEETLVEERERLERSAGSKLYDVTAWSLARQFDLDAWWCTPPEREWTRVSSAPRAGLEGLVLGDSTQAYAWIVDGSEDRSVRFAAQALELGLQLHLADEEFEVLVALDGAEPAPVQFPRGSLLLRRHENPEGVDELVARVAQDARVDVYVTHTGRAPGEDPDLGGGHFQLLARPRVALLANSPVSSSAYGHVWHYLDEQLRMPLSILDAQTFGSHDLRRYNVLVLPPARGLERALGPHAEKLRDWVRSGGTLIACGASAAALTAEAFDLTAVVRRRDALEDLDEFAFLARRARSAREVSVDIEALWGDAASAEPADEEGARAARPEQDEDPDEADQEEADEGKKDEGAGTDPDVDPDPERRDAWKRRFSPAGVILRGITDSHSWITVGTAQELPVPFSGATVLLTRNSAPVRLASRERLRLGGLLWPEARERLADSAWLTVERSGHGQVILFAASPAFRGSWRGTARLLANSIVYGPGAGADQPRGW